MSIFKNVSNLLFFNISDFKMKFILKWYIFFSILKIPKIIRNNWFLLLLISKYVLFYNDIFFLIILFSKENRIHQFYEYNIMASRCVARRFTGTFPAVLWRYLTCHFPFQYRVQGGGRSLMMIWRYLTCYFPFQYISFKGVADFHSSWWYEDIWHVISHFNK